MAAKVNTTKRFRPACRLEPFDPRHAARVMSWVTDAREAFWLAPRTRPPLTAEEVLSWQQPGHQSLLLFPLEGVEPVGYGELNVMTSHPRRYWLGHLIVDPGCRGCGYGVQLTKLLLWRAFSRHGAHEVSLVVFPENRAAIACYQRAGMVEDGHETHAFPAYDQRVRLLRMVARGWVGRSE
jgi:RimJ/RimL family protein N-acetyltransferase